MNSSYLEKEISEFPEIIKQHIKDEVIVESLVNKLKENSFIFISTIARGSSDLAALFAKYLIENKLHIPVSSYSLSISTLYNSYVRFNSSLVIAISQSGQSHDLIQSFTQCQKNGGTTLALVNNENSPLFQIAQYRIPLLAGTENSVAASKSFLASISRLIQFVTLWTRDLWLKSSYAQLPEILINLASAFDWKETYSSFKKIKSMYVVGRGYGLPIALEAALKLKETCGIHAEGFSAAELLHGPFELVQEKFPVIIFVQGDETHKSMLTLLEKLQEKKAEIFIIGPSDTLNIFQNYKVKLLKTSKKSIHPVLDLMVSIYCFYFFVNELSFMLGRNPDKPRNLVKVTKTL